MSNVRFRQDEEDVSHTWVRKQWIAYPFGPAVPPRKHFSLYTYWLCDDDNGHASLPSPD